MACQHVEVVASGTGSSQQAAHDAATADAIAQATILCARQPDCWVNPDSVDELDRPVFQQHTTPGLIICTFRARVACDKPRPDPPKKKSWWDWIADHAKEIGIGLAAAAVVVVVVVVTRRPEVAEETASEVARKAAELVGK